MKKSKKTIVAFQIGRGGAFNNPGHLSFLGEHEIKCFTNDLYTIFENQASFSERYGYSYTHSHQPCIIDLIANEDFDALEKAFGITKEMLGPEIYFDQCGNPVGLTKDECDSGIGRIDVDGHYNTIYTKLLSDCDQDEIDAIKTSNRWEREHLLDFFEEN